jgi:hypothetical protein
MKTIVIVGIVIVVIVVFWVIVGVMVYMPTIQKQNTNTSPSVSTTPTPVPTQTPTPTSYSTPTTSTNMPTITPSPMVTPTPTSTPIVTATPTATPTPTKSVAISYTMVTKQSFVWMGFSGTSYVQQADSGKVFLEVNMTIKNNGYDSFNTNPYYFNAVADNIKYSVDGYTYYVDNWDTVDVLNGGTFRGTLLFQIPESARSYVVGYEAFLTNYNLIWTKT